ncbi:phosphodiester glycosidase family protein [Gloeocapsopsis dulcis]|nr:phosphodiester glycosidase family protein [Gloeocapsopsis dulcis]WNN91081.1 phosphodiester glycosidase family protein [Gloeocapsopsis dulcis]
MPISRTFFVTSTLFPLLTIALWLTPIANSDAQQSLELPSSSDSKLLIAQSSTPRLVATGTQVSINNRTLPAAWSQWQQPTKSGIATAMSDTGLMQLLGVELLNTKNVTKQSVQWFSPPTTSAFELDAWHRDGYRYLDITQLATKVGWQLQVHGNILRINTPAAKIQNIRQGKQAWGDRIVIDLNRPTFWQVTSQPVAAKPQSPSPSPANDDDQPPNQEWLITIDAATDQSLTQQFQPSLPEQLTSTPATNQTSVLQVETASNLTTIRLSVPAGLSPQLSTLPNPNRLVIDLRPDPMVERDIQWATGVRWRQQFVTLGNSRFPVVLLEINPQTTELSLKPISSVPNSLTGTAPIITTAQQLKAAAAINAGFFNRKNQLPLGAIRRDGQWLSGPILNRGAIAWNDSGKFKFGRLQLQETIITAAGQRLPVVTFNSGYVKSGIAHYTSTWGATYTPLIDDEIIVVVQNNQVTGQVPGGVAGETTIPIPPNGFLLTLRANPQIASLLPVGSIIRTENSTTPADFSNYPHILGGGPLLLQNRQIVLNAEAEGFSQAFSRQKASRSAIGTTTTGNLLIAAVHNRAGGAGPSLTEIAQIMQHLGCVDALNLDGGSSTSLYLGGQLLDRSPRTAARIHNGLGIFLQPRS